jgi:hypothetical protein
MQVILLRLLHHHRHCHLLTEFFLNYDLVLLFLVIRLRCRKEHHQSHHLSPDQYRYHQHLPAEEFHQDLLLRLRFDQALMSLNL